MLYKCKIILQVLSVYYPVIQPKEKRKEKKIEYWLVHHIDSPEQNNRKKKPQMIYPWKRKVKVKLASLYS